MAAEYFWRFNLNIINNIITRGIFKHFSNLRFFDYDMYFKKWKKIIEKTGKCLLLENVLGERLGISCIFCEHNFWPDLIRLTFHTSHHSSVDIVKRKCTITMRVITAILLISEYMSLLRSVFCFEGVDPFSNLGV